MRVFFLLLLMVREKTDVWAKDQKKSERRGVVGGSTTLPCHAPPEEQQDVDFEWTFGNETNVIIDYTNDIDNEGYERVKFIGDLTKGNASITIEDLRLNDSGVYKCEWTYYSQSGFHDDYTLVNLTITETTTTQTPSPPPLTPSPPLTSSLPPPAPASPQKSLSHIVAAVVVTLVMVISVAVAVYLCKRKNGFCWRENIEYITAEENIPMNARSSNNRQNDGEKKGDLWEKKGDLQTSLATDLEHNNVDVT